MNRGRFRALCIGSMLLLGSASAAIAQYHPPGMQTAATAPGGGRQKITTCTGGQGGNYYFSAQQMSRYVGMNVAIQPVTTQGSLEISQRVTNGSCDVGFAQNDAVRLYRDLDVNSTTKLIQVMSLYKEYGHLLCNRESGITKLSQLKKGNVIAIGPEGSGANVTWQAIVAANKQYKAVDTTADAGNFALAAVKTGTNVTCMLYVGGIGDTLIKRDAMKFAKDIVLVNINEGLDQPKDARGRSIYSYETIPEGMYGDLMPSGSLYGHNAIKTFAVDAYFVVNEDWRNAHPQQADLLLQALGKATPAILDHMKPPKD